MCCKRLKTPSLTCGYVVYRGSKQHFIYRNCTIQDRAHAQKQSKMAGDRALSMNVFQNRFSAARDLNDKTGSI